jgi:hypothetical protein
VLSETVPVSFNLFCEKTDDDKKDIITDKRKSMKLLISFVFWLWRIQANEKVRRRDIIYDERQKGLDIWAYLFFSIVPKAMITLI